MADLLNVYTWNRCGVAIIPRAVGYMRNAAVNTL